MQEYTLPQFQNPVVFINKWNASKPPARQLKCAQKLPQFQHVAQQKTGKYFEITVKENESIYNQSLKTFKFTE